MANYAKVATPPPHVSEDQIVDFDLYDMPGARHDLFESILTLQTPDKPDIVWTPYNEGHWITTRGSVLKKIMADHQHFSNRVFIVPKSVGALQYFAPLSIDPPAHARFRKPLNNLLASPTAIASRESAIRAVVRRLVGEIAAKGKCDFTRDFAEVVPTMVFTSLVDVPLEDAIALREKAMQVTRPTGVEGGAQEGLEWLTNYLTDLVDSRLGKPGEDLISSILNYHSGDDALTRAEAVAVCTNVFFGGLDTLLTFLGFVMLFLARSPEHRRQLIADRALIPAAIDELFRRFSVGMAAREVLEDVEMGGASMKQGEMVLLPLPLAGLDDRDNEDPMTVDFHRKDASQAAFGKGVHFCPGANLARLEARLVLEEWLERIPEFEIEPGAEITYSSGVVGKLDTLPLIWEPQPST
jgi:cytochrome P450